MINLDLAKLKAAAAMIKSSNSTLPKHEAWIPAPEKDAAKAAGVVWNKEVRRHEYAAADADAHPAARYQPKNFYRLVAQIPPNAKETFKEAGVVSRPDGNGVWHDYIMKDEAYNEVIIILNDLELL